MSDIEMLTIRCFLCGELREITNAHRLEMLQRGFHTPPCAACEESRKEKHLVVVVRPLGTGIIVVADS